MKKALSIILSVLVIFSMFSMAVSAADYSADIVTIKFYVDDELYQEIKVMPGETFGQYMKDYPVKASTETTKYSFKHWSSAVFDEEEGIYKPDGKVTGTKNLPAVPEGAGIKEVVYAAVFVEEDIVENQTFWAFLQSIFARINDLFEYFAKVFEGVIEI